MNSSKSKRNVILGMCVDYTVFREITRIRRHTVAERRQICVR